MFRRKPASRWEYNRYIGSRRAEDVAEVALALEQLGSDGWELVSVHAVGAENEFWFKRPRP